MTSKERMLVAISHGQPDMVPVAPDISGMLPTKRAGRPYWDNYLFNNPPVWKLYLDQVKKFGFDGWFIYGSLSGKSKDDKRKFRRVILEKTHDKIVVRDYCETPEGTLWQERVYFRDNPEVLRPSNWVKDLERDFEIYLKYFFPDPSSCDDKCKIRIYKNRKRRSVTGGLLVPASVIQASMTYTLGSLTVDWRGRFEYIINTMI